MAGYYQRAERWDESETAVMLTIMQKLDIVQLLHKNQHSHAAVFEKIREPMAEKGYKRTANEIKAKWRTLKSIYHDVKKRELKSSGCGKRKFKFFDEMEELFGNRPEYNIGELMQSHLTVECASEEHKEPWANGEAEFLVYDNLALPSTSESDSRTTPERPPSPHTSTCRPRRIVRDRQRIRSGRRPSSDESMERYKESLTELLTSVTKDNREFFAAEMEKQRNFEKELFEANQSHMKASMDAMMQVLLATRSPAMLPSQQSKTSDKGDSM